MTKTIFEYHNLTVTEKELLSKVCNHPYKISIAPLDKGLSGAKTLLGRIHDKTRIRKRRFQMLHSKFYVFKIGKMEKIKYEYEQITGIAEKIISGFPTTYIAYSDDKQMAVLKQEFIGGKDGQNYNLKKFIENATDYTEVFEIVNKLYNTEIINWRQENEDSSITVKKDKTSYADIFKDWVNKGTKDINIVELLKDIGSDEIAEVIVRYYGFTLEVLQQLIVDVSNDHAKIEIGPVHGDLHAENILINTSNNNKLSLIDFGWTGYRWRAVDFIWLECSLRYVVCSPYISLKNYLYADDILDEYWGREQLIDYSQILSKTYGKELAKIVAGIAAIRQNVRTLNIIQDLNEYRKGLILMSYSLISLEKINKLFLLHTVCDNIIKLKEKTRKSICQYDQLYGTKGILWPDTPGRMVVKALNHFKKPGLCLDIGCGDGKNMMYLEQLGWKVDGFDKSFLAINGAHQRFTNGSLKVSGSLSLNDAIDYNYPNDFYDLVVCYGLYHCLSDDEVYFVHNGMIDSLKSGGIIAFCMLNNNLPMPLNHGTTDKIYLRNESFIGDLNNDRLEILESFTNEIEEDHLPVIDKHKHSVTWCLFRKK